MKYPIGTKLIPKLGDGYGLIVDIKNFEYVVIWEDKFGERLHTESHMEQIIRHAHYTAELPIKIELPEDLFTI